MGATAKRVSRAADGDEDQQGAREGTFTPGRRSPAIQISVTSWRRSGHMRPRRIEPPAWPFPGVGRPGRPGRARTVPSAESTSDAVPYGITGGT
ncbi:hypothetical protein GMJLKIPL_5782 [Methylobacterium isbiliense]|jgi:hypothetical protein|uniref:Uncharacterized protein n=1 Tax=Methylobacterium isbiliense TaxID=315478 RepID=A0ABQ4SKW2_9HYPH|nr:hypothetical protein GMJLKIPL_5782 [Methylobacterium isbiliense]